jgi:hypothetical protein
MTEIGHVFGESWFHRRPEPNPVPIELLVEILEQSRDTQEAIRHIDKRLEHIMADISGLTTDVETLTASVSSASTALNDLADQIAVLTAGAVTQEQIDALDASVKAASSALDSSVATDDPQPAPAPVDPTPVDPNAPTA